MTSFPSMPTVIRHKSKSKPTSLHFTAIRPLPYVHSHMFRSCPRPFERHLTILPWKFKRPIIFMYSQVQNCVFVRPELFTTPFMGTPVPFVQTQLFFCFELQFTPLSASPDGAGGNSGILGGASNILSISKRTSIFLTLYPTTINQYSSFASSGALVSVTLVCNKPRS